MTRQFCKIWSSMVAIIVYSYISLSCLSSSSIPTRILITGGQDYLPAMATLTLEPDSPVECLEVVIVDDNEPEMALEYFALLLSSTDPDVSIALPLMDVAIKNKDSKWLRSIPGVYLTYDLFYLVIFGFIETEIYVCEGEGSVTLCLEVTGESVDQSEFTISTTNTGYATRNVFWEKFSHCSVTR